MRERVAIIGKGKEMTKMILTVMTTVEVVVA